MTELGRMCPECDSDRRDLRYNTPCDNAWHDGGDHDCSRDGHDFEFLMSAASAVPFKVICDSCGSAWRLESA